MTHPDILQIERTGYKYPEEKPKYIGECEHCGLAIYDDNGDALQSKDGIFCGEECMREFYEVGLIN